jgi:hypothetical protein
MKKPPGQLGGFFLRTLWDIAQGNGGLKKRPPPGTYVSQIARAKTTSNKAVDE